MYLLKNKNYLRKKIIRRKKQVAKHKLKGTLMQVWKSPYMFAFI